MIYISSIVVNHNLNIFDSGESMENALRACCKGIKIGKILIHREGDNGQNVSHPVLLCPFSLQH